MTFIPLALVPLSLLLHYVVGVPSFVDFALGAVAIAVLADWTRRATEQLAERAGPTIGGLLNVSFGSIAEVILALFVLIDGQAEVVRAQLTGSIMGTSLLGLGIAILVGGVGREKQVFNRERAGQLSTMLMLVVIALLMPAIFDLTGRTVTHTGNLGLSDELLSLAVSVVLLALYGGNLVYTLVTHRDIFASADERGTADWSLPLSLGVLVGATLFVAIEAEIVSGALKTTAYGLHLSPMFLGVVVLALVGTGGDLIAAVFFARQDKMGLVLNISIGSAIQIALVVAPLLVLISWALGHPMTLVFSNPLQLFAIASTAFIVRAIAADGETTWFEGLLLVGVYSLFALGFFFVDRG
ncbi:calcium/proton exchanger [Lichenihabitans psoromatis]|uniref:calcium/proton exchanger n=1 Tax=Lichenihabitans psoromatis TaxID=2528642 RepID=UPI001035D1A7|nr:calcium/proton exchanger [Lichenihabitans psoromatis]